MSVRIKKLVFFLSAIIIAALVVLYVVQRPAHKQAASVAPDQPILVSVRPVKKYIIPETLTSYGTIVSPKSVVLTAQLSGEITSINFTAGQKVTAGQLLFTIKATDTAQQPDKLRAVMQTSKDVYYRMLLEEKRAPGSIVQQILLKNKLQYQQDLASYRQSIALQNITSPVAGVVTNTTLAVGSSVTPGTNLASVINPKSVAVQYSADNSLANKIAIGQAVEFYPSGSEQSYSAQLSYISPELSATDYNLTLRANFSSVSNLRPNMFGKVVQIINKDSQVLAVEQDLVQTDATGFYVLAVVDNKVTKHYFESGKITKSGLIEVKSGLTAGFPIIVTNVSKLSVGQVVHVSAK